MCTGGAMKHQRGATAVELALVFPVFFIFFYGCLMYGLIFLMRMGIQHAAEDGARAALSNQVITYTAGQTAVQHRQAQMLQRIQAAIQTASARASWMSHWHALNINAYICPVNVACPGSPMPDCNSTTPCQVVVTVSYPYATSPVLPTLPGFGLLAPSSLSGQARVLLDGRALPIT